MGSIPRGHADMPGNMSQYIYHATYVDNYNQTNACRGLIKLRTNDCFYLLQSHNIILLYIHFTSGF